MKYTQYGYRGGEAMLLRAAQDQEERDPIVTVWICGYCNNVGVDSCDCGRESYKPHTMRRSRAVYLYGEEVIS